MGFRLAALKAAIKGKPDGMARFFSSTYRHPPDRNTAEFLDTYTKSPRLSPVTKISTDLSVVTGKLYRIKSDGSRDEITDHPFLDFLAKPNPLPFMTRVAMWKCLEQYLLIKGEAPAIIERNPAGFPAELWPLPPNWMLDIPSLNNPYYLIRNREGLQIPVPVEDVFLIRQLNPVDPYGRGLGDAEPVADEIETDEYMAKWAKRFFFNDATPPTVISAPGMVENEFKRFQATWDDRFRGVGNAQKTGIIPREIAIHKLVDSQREMDFAHSRKDLRDGVNSHFGVPPEILGIVENSNRATATQAKIIYAENVLMPRLVTRQDAINLQLLQPYWGDDLFYEYDDIVPEDTEFRLQQANSGMEKATLLVDEWREQNGFDPLPNNAGQIIYVPFAAIPTKPEELTRTVRTTGENEATIWEANPIGDDPLPGTKANLKRRRQIAYQQRLRGLLAEERKVQQHMGRFFDGQLATILKALQTGKKDAGEDFWAKITAAGGLSVKVDELRNVVNEALAQLIDWEAQDETLTAALNPAWVEAFDLGAKSTAESFGITAMQTPSLTNYLRQQGFKRVREINNTTRDKLANSLADGLDAGESQQQLIERIKQYMPTIQTDRAATIAQVEAHTSMQEGSFQQMRYGGVKTKTWVTAGDSDVRDTHAALNGQTVPIDQPFSNGLMYPGDPAGSPEEIIRCRCDMMPGDF